MNARIVFVFGLLFTLLNVVMALTTHGGLFIMAGLGLIITLGSANYIWGTPAGAMGDDDDGSSAFDDAPCGAEESMAGHTFTD